MLLIVSDKVLDGSRDTVALETVDVRGRDQSRESWVFREGFESTSTERGSLDVDSGSEQADGITGLGLGSEQTSGVLGEGLGEGGSNTGGIRESRCGG